MGARDYKLRREFCQIYLNLRQNVAAHGLDLAALIFHSDECTFTNNGMFNQRDHVYWADHNPE